MRLLLRQQEKFLKHNTGSKATKSLEICRYDFFAFHFN